MRRISDHVVNPANDKLAIEVMDEPGSGEASHLYVITGFNPDSNPSLQNGENNCEILFQNGPINEVGVNGVTHEALIAVVIDRPRCFQDGPYLMMWAS